MKRVAVMGFAAALLAGPALAQQPDRATLAAAEARRCINAMMSRAAILSAAGSSVESVCACESNLLASQALPHEIPTVLALLRTGKLPERYFQIAKTSEERCLAAAAYRYLNNQRNQRSRVTSCLDLGAGFVSCF